MRRLLSRLLWALAFLCERMGGRLADVAIALGKDPTPAHSGYVVHFTPRDFGSFGLPESILPPEDPPPTPANRGQVAK